MAKGYANRPSQSRQRWVTDAQGNKVENMAFNGFGGNTGTIAAPQAGDLMGQMNTSAIDKPESDWAPGSPFAQRYDQAAANGDLARLESYAGKTFAYETPDESVADSVVLMTPPAEAAKDPGAIYDYQSALNHPEIIGSKAFNSAANGMSDIFTHQINDRTIQADKISKAIAKDAEFDQRIRGAEDELDKTNGFFNRRRAKRKIRDIKGEQKAFRSVVKDFGDTKSTNPREWIDELSSVRNERQALDKSFDNFSVYRQSASNMLGGGNLGNSRVQQSLVDSVNNYEQYGQNPFAKKRQ